jgi:hypothetical protein
MTKIVFVVAIAAAVAVMGCGKSAQQKKLEEAAKAMEQAGKSLQEGANQMAEGMKQLEGDGKEGKAVEPVDFRELKVLLPERAAGIARSEIKGERNAVMGIKVSEASAEYATEEGSSIRIKIMDMGSVSGIVGLATVAWSHAEIDSETETGYEKTTTFSGHKAFEKFDTASKDGQLSILVGGRFVVEVEGSNVTMDQLKTTAGQIDLGKLESMKNVGVPG